MAVVPPDLFSFFTMTTDKKNLGNTELLCYCDGRVTFSITSIISYVVVVVVVVITPPLPRDGGTARKAIQVHAVNLIDIRLGERWQPISSQS